MSRAVAVPPHDLDAEQAVLGAVLLSDRALAALSVEEGLRPEHFYREAHALIYTAMLALHIEAEPVDVLTVTDQLRRAGTLGRAGGSAAVELLAASVPAVGNLRRYAQIVTEHAQARALLAVTHRIQASVLERRGDTATLLANAEQQIFALGQQKRRARQIALSQAISAELDDLEHRARQPGLTGLATGFRDLDELLAGLHPGNLIVLAARPAMGKSCLALNIAAHAALNERASVLFAALEMSASETVQRYLAHQAGVNADRLRKATLRAGDWTALLAAAQRATQSRFTLIDDSDLTVFDLRARARAIAVAQDGLDLVVVDYLQLLRADPASGNRAEDVSAFSRGLKRLARELDCPVLALAQLNRAVEARNDKRPLMSDLRESGSIEADSDVVLMLYRDDYYHPDSERPGQIDVLIRKARSGPLGDITLIFDPPRQRFLKLEPRLVA